MRLCLQRPVRFLYFPCSKAKSGCLAVHPGVRPATVAHLRLVRTLLVLLRQYLTKYIYQRARSRTRTITFTAPTSTRPFEFLHHLTYHDIAAVLISLLSSASRTLLSFLSSLWRSPLNWAVGQRPSSWRTFLGRVCNYRVMNAAMPRTFSTC